MGTEADTCRTLITPQLQAVGWDSVPHSIAEQLSFTDGRIVVHGSQAKRRPVKRADYLLRFTRDFPIAVAEAKADHEAAATTKIRLHANSPAPGKHYCHDCEKYFD